MNKDLPKQSNSEEIDIVEIFNLIGRAFKAVFDFIINIFEQIFMLLILLALFIRRNFIILAVAAILGFGIGFISDRYQKVFYTSTMVVEPNFETSNQLVENIKLFAQLARSRDTVILSQVLSISPREAAKIISIEIGAKNTRTDRLMLFDDFVKDADSTTLKNITFEDFEENLTIDDYRQFYIVLAAKDKSVFRKVEKSILEFPITPYIQSLKDTELANLNAQAINIKLSLDKMDSLRTDYKKIMLENEQITNRPNGSGTTFYMGTENLRATNELQLFDLERNYNVALEEINLKKAQKENYINVISGFQDIGIRVKEQNKYLYALIALGLAMVFLILKEFNSFLISQEKKLKRSA